jgi:hypothetical protein
MKGRLLAHLLIGVGSICLGIGLVEVIFNPAGDSATERWAGGGAMVVLGVFDIVLGVRRGRLS